MRPHLTRRTAVKTLLCGVACFGLPDCFVKRIFPAGAALAFSQEYNPGYELGEKIYVPVRSSVLNEDRTAETDSDDQYDTIYILDGIRAYHYAAYDYLRGEGFIPKRTILILFFSLLGLKGDLLPHLKARASHTTQVPTSDFVSV